MTAQSSVDVSIVILNQNEGVFLQRCIRSCLAQTFPGRFHQVLVADAASQDFSREVIRSYGNQIVPVLLDDSASGLTEAAVAGIRLANGRFLMTVRAQDFLSDYSVLIQTIWLYQNQQDDGVSVDYWLVDPRSDAKIRRVSGQTHPRPHGTLYRKEVFLKEGLYESTPHAWSVESFQQRVADKYRIGHLPIPFYRCQQDAEERADCAAGS
jgi:glycosyltransferase involved in cell wall biosynthesis